MVKYLKVIAAVSTVLMLCSCAEEFYDDPMPISSESEEEEPETEPVTVDLDKILGKDDHSSSYSYEDDYSDWSYYSTDDFSETEFSENEFFEEETEEIPTEDETEVSTEISTEEETENADEEESIGESEEEKPTEAPKEKHTKAPKAKGLDVPYISQEELPTGCELVSTAMLLGYYDYFIEPMELLDGGYIPVVDVEKKNGKIVAGDPNKAYIGDPQKDTGFGCYSTPIYNGLKKLLKDDFFDVYDLSGMSLDELCSLYIDMKQPVVIWASINMEPSNEDDNTTWTIKDSDEEFEWKSNEHCVVLVGYDDKYYYINDPQKGACVPYERSVVTKRYEEMGSQAVTVIGW